MIFSRLTFILLLAAFAVPVPTAEAQTPVARSLVKVSTRIVRPFVMRDERGNLTGFSTDLWNAIARDIGATTEFVVTDSVQGILSDVASGKTDLGIAAISITAVSYTHLPMLSAETVSSINHAIVLLKRNRCV